MCVCINYHLPNVGTKTLRKNKKQQLKLLCCLFRSVDIKLTLKTQLLITLAFYITLVIFYKDLKGKKLAGCEVGGSLSLKLLKQRLEAAYRSKDLSLAVNTLRRLFTLPHKTTIPEASDASGSLHGCQHLCTDKYLFKR